MKFANKLSLSVTAVAFVVVPLLGFAISHVVRQIASEAIVSQQLATADHLIGDIDQALARANDGIRVISEDVFLFRFLARTGAVFSSDDGGDLSREFDERGKMTGPWYGLMAIDRDGRIVLSTLKESVGRNIRDFAAARLAYQTAQRGGYFRSDVQRLDTGSRTTVVMAAPVMTEDHTRVLGAVLGYFDWTAILRVLDQSDARGRTYLVNHDGLILAAMIREQDRILRDRLPGSELLDTARAGKVANGTFTLERGGEPQLATAIAVGRRDGGNQHGWILLQATPLSVVFAPVDEMTRNILAGVSTAMLTMAVLFYAMGRRLAGPVEQLTATVEAVATGRLNSRARVESNDELGTLATAFNKMTMELSAQREELSATKTFLEGIVNTSAGVIFTIDPRGRFEYVNDRGLAIVGYGKEELFDQPFLMLFSPDTHQDLQEEFAAVMRGETMHDHKRVVIRKDGAPRWIEYSSVPLTRDGKVIRIVGTATDITDRKQHEERVKTALAEKEALLREIHHRVKNNMQVVISLLNLEAGKIADPDVLNVLRDAQRRIEVMALVHEKLHQSRELAEVDAKSYIEDLARSAFHAQQRRSTAVRLTLAVSSVGLGLDAATPCGLIVNELISNALKHAFPGERAGEVRVALQAADDGAVELTVSDDGVGMPEDFDWRGSQTLGLRLVRNLVERQLQGQLDLDRTRGTEWKVRFAV